MEEVIVISSDDEPDPAPSTTKRSTHSAARTKARKKKKPRKKSKKTKPDPAPSTTKRSTHSATRTKAKKKKKPRKKSKKTKLFTVSPGECEGEEVTVVPRMTQIDATLYITLAFYLNYLNTVWGEKAEPERNILPDALYDEVYAGFLKKK